VKRFMLALLIFSAGCSSWKQKDFEKDLDKASEEALPEISATPKEEKILEQFEVKPALEKKDNDKPAAKPQPKPKVVIKKVQTKSGPKTVAVEVPPPGKQVKPIVKTLPADYPPEFISVNEKAKKVWDLYKPSHTIDEKVYLDIHYLGMTVGKIMVMNKGKKMVDDKEVWHFHARFKSAPFYSNIYELNDTVDTYVTTDQFLSKRYSLIQRETKQDIDDLQLHDHDQFKTFWFYKRKKSDGSVKEKKEEKPIPYYSIDPFSVLFFYQGLPLKNGDVYEIPVINKGKVLILKSMVEGRERIKTDKGTKNAIRLHATTNYTGETLKSGDLYFWFSDDSKRTLLKAQAKIKIGSVTADIVEN
jgi:hypothetical protein